MSIETKARLEVIGFTAKGLGALVKQQLFTANPS
tara:strand:- start:527 stop:628 length:102 start_codon:yes stop_codon:yes gene_type:complete